MKKRLICLILGITFVLSMVACSTGTIDDKELLSDAFVILHIPHEVDYNTNGVIRARYTDTKEPIPLSQCYDNRLYATVPKENADRGMEAFVTEVLEFADYDAGIYEFYPFKELSRTGVIQGNENGEALPFANITRAEATAMLMRLFGIKAEENHSLTFEDVSKEEWYYGVIAAANKSGIVTGDSETLFSPNRNVSREEFVVMAARAITYAGLGYPGDDNLNAVDKDTISEWAKDAYCMIGNYVPTDYDNTDPETPVRLLHPQKPATRHDVVDTLHVISYACCIYPSSVAEQFGFDKEMPIIDGSTSTYPFTEAVYQTLFANGQNHPSKPHQHSKSHVTYQKLINGEIDMMFASVYPASDILKMAEEKGVELELIPIAYDAMIFFTNHDNPIESLTTEQISEIYVNNAYQNWKELGGSEALLYPYCRNNDSGSHAQMEKHFLNGNPIHPKIQLETTSVTMANVLTDVMHAKTEQPLGYGLGYSIYYYFNNMDMFYNTKTELKLLAINGVHPNDTTIANGSYPLSNNTYIVLRKDAPQDASARKMAEFMLTAEGQTCVELAGFGKLK